MESIRNLQRYLDSPPKINEYPLLDTGITLGLMAALHGMLIDAGVATKDQELSGHESVEMATEYLKSKRI